MHDPKAALAGKAPVLTPQNVSDFDIETHNLAAQRYLLSGQPDMALPHLRRITTVKPDDPGALDGMSKAYLELGVFSQALENIDRLIEISNDSGGSGPSASLQVRRAVALYNLKRTEESEAAISTVLSKDPKNAEALCFMGQMEAAADEPNPKTVEDYFRRAIAADSTYAESYYQLARFYENKGDYKSASSFLKQVLALDPLNVRAHARLGMVCYYQLDSEGALRYYQTALALNPHDYNTRYNLGELYRTLLDDNVNALKEFTLTIQDNPTHGDANYKAGLICMENGMTKEAIKYFEDALQNDRQNTRRVLQLAAAYEILGDRNAALSVYKEITDIDPKDNIALQKIRVLEEDQGGDE
jgi:tetratricopeptide (TPR) repeat protein